MQPSTVVDTHRPTEQQKSCNFGVQHLLQTSLHFAVLQVKIIIIDSIAFHFRQDFQDMAQRTRVLAEMAQNLMHLAEDKDLAVRN